MRTITLLQLGTVAAAFAAAAPANASTVRPDSGAQGNIPRAATFAISPDALGNVLGRIDNARSLTIEARIRESGPSWVQFIQHGKPV